MLCLFVGCDKTESKEELTPTEAYLSEVSTEVQEANSQVSTEAEEESEASTEAVEESEPSTAPSEVVQAPVTPAKGQLDTITKEIGLSVETIEIDLPNVQNTYQLMFVNDMHILRLDDTIAGEKLEEARTRHDIMFRTRKGVSSADAWLKLASVLDEFKADGIIFGGDMMDFTSNTNGEVLMEGLAQIHTPYMYLRADHDLGTWYSGGALTEADALVFHNVISTYQDMFVMEYPEFYVLGWNNSTSQITDEAMNTVYSIWNKGKPIILATHVPINSLIDNGLADTAASLDPHERKKLWGDGCLYSPDDNTSTFLGMVYDENGPIKAVLSGHLHFRYTIQLTQNTVQHVLAPSFEGNISKIIVK